MIYEQIVYVGTGVDVTIKKLVELVKKIVGFNGGIVFDTTKPDGTPRKLMSVEKLNELDWQAKVPLEKGIELTYQWYGNNI